LQVVFLILWGGHLFRLTFKFLKLALSLILAAAIFVAATNVYVVASTRGNVHTIAQMQQQQTTSDAIVVLGASVYANGTPSDILADRLEVAADLYFEGVSPVIIVSGDNTSAHYNESDAMKAYCISLGVPASAIYVDHAGYDTYASIYRAKYVYGAQSITVVTQAYHLYRALSIAQTLGLEATGAPADKGEYNNQKMYSAREVFARSKDLVQSLLLVTPQDVNSEIVP
jgi:vancomycin permeability regulator SanA